MILRTLLLAALVAVGATAAPAAVLGTFAYDYGTGGRTALVGTAEAGGLRLSGTEADVFLDAYDLRSLAGATLTGFELTVGFSDAGPANGPDRERWRIEIAGSDALSGRIFRNNLRDSAAPMTFVFDETSGGRAGQVFDAAIAGLSLSFGFDLRQGDTASTFLLTSATLTAFGTSATVPVPAPGLLLLGALGWAGLRRRQGPDPA